MGHENRVSNIVYNQPLVLGKRTESEQLVVVGYNKLIRFTQYSVLGRQITLFGFLAILVTTKKIESYPLPIID